MSHPINRDLFRTFLSKRSLLTLIVIYILITLVCSGVIATIWTITSTTTPSIADEFVWKLWYSFVFLYGYQPNLLDIYTEGSHIVAVFLSVLSVLLPSLLLGTVVFKIFIPDKQIAIFREKLTIAKISPEAEDDKYFLHIYYYIASKLRLTDLNVDAHVRVLFKDESLRFRLWTFPLDNPIGSKIPLPYSYIPTRVSIPVAVNDDINTDDHPSQMLFIKTEDNQLSIRRVKDREINQYDECELILVLSATIPHLDNDLIEYHRYSIPSQINFGEYLKFEVEYGDVNEKPRIVPEKWDDFW